LDRCITAGADAAHPHPGSAMKTKKPLLLFHFPKDPPVATLEPLQCSPHTPVLTGEPSSASAEACEVA
jgi:hypothetical protein